MTTTCSTDTGPGVVVVDGDEFGEAASCAIAMVAPKSSVVAAVKTFFIEIFEKWIFQSGCRGVCAKRLFGLASALDTSAATTGRDLGEVRFLALRENAAQLRANRAQVARARKCMRQETATEPSAGSTPEFWRIERPRRVR